MGRTQEARARVVTETDAMEEMWMDMLRHQYRETTQRLTTSDPDQGLAREIDQDGYQRSD